MSLSKVTYVDGQTVIYANNLNDIQDAILANEESISDLAEITPLNLTLDTAGKAADAKAVGDRFADLEYEPIAIESYSITPSQAEMGTTITSEMLSYTFNKTPYIITIDGSIVPNPSKTGIQDLYTTLTHDNNHGFVLYAEDSGHPSDPTHATVTRTVSVSFLNRVYYGAAAAPSSVDSSFLTAFSDKPLAATKARTFSVNATSGKYIWYAVPTRLGTCTFKVGGFEGGFGTPQTVSVTNASGYTENYYVYKSDNAGLGQTTVVVS